VHDKGRTIFIVRPFLLSAGFTFFERPKKVNKEKPSLRDALNMLQCFYELQPPSPARAVPTPHLVFHTPIRTPFTTPQQHNGPHTSETYLGFYIFTF